MNFKLNLDSSSSSSSADEINDYMLMDFAEESREIQAIKDAGRYVVHSTVEGARNEGLRPRKKRTYISRDRESANGRLIADYFSLHYRFFQQNLNACMRQGATTFQKWTAVIRMLAYGFVVQIDEYLKFGATTSKKCLTLTHFVDGIVTQFSAKYLRKPSTKDVQCLLREGEDRGFLGMIGSNGCMHWEWKLVRKGCIMEDLEQRL